MPAFLIRLVLGATIGAILGYLYGRLMWSFAGRTTQFWQWTKTTFRNTADDLL